MWTHKYKIVIVWLPGTDTSGSVLPLLCVARGAEVEVHSQLITQSYTAPHRKASTLPQWPLLMPGTQEMINTYFLVT